MPNPPSSRIYTPAEAKAVWHIREAGPRAAAFAPGAPPEWEGWDDAAVAPEKLGGYLRDIRKLMNEYDYQGAFYGHFGHGCIHMRVSFDLESEKGIRNYGEFVERAADLVVSYGGSLSGEHGDGQSRGALLPKMFGPELVPAFGEFKAAWDPENRMNPHKVIEPYLPTENLRLGADYHPAEPHTHFAYPDDHGSFAKASLRCLGLGACRKQDAGTMCPSYMATLEEEHSTRGRAHMLFEMLQGEVTRDGWNDEHVKKSLDLCLSCKACKTECPANVDVATYKAEFLAHYYRGPSASAARLRFRHGRQMAAARLHRTGPGQRGQSRAPLQPIDQESVASRFGTAVAGTRSAEFPQLGKEERRSRCGRCCRQMRNARLFSGWTPLTTICIRKRLGPRSKCCRKPDSTSAFRSDTSAAAALSMTSDFSTKRNRI